MPIIPFSIPFPSICLSEVMETYIKYSAVKIANTAKANKNIFFILKEK
ncbi:hypothetical protein [Chitinophaga terrae (ex Kim and Jung 2007)]|nr:hypothetical protein [Chitinophaga terrae (ex Kim and Jung 2007)]